MLNWRRPRSFEYEFQIKFANIMMQIFKFKFEKLKYEVMRARATDLL